METIRDSYDAVAEEYARRIAGELAHKPFDRDALDAFAVRHAGRGLVGDIGCGPGHVSAYLAARGVEVLGLDLSPALVAEARRLHPDLPCEVGDMLRLSERPGRFAALLAFYALVHLPPSGLAAALRGFRTALRPGGEVLLAVHLGEAPLRLESWWGREVDLTFHLFTEAEVRGAVAQAGLREAWCRVRDPYPEVEYPTRRLYLSALA